MDKKKILHIVIVIVIALSVYLTYHFIKKSSVNRQIQKEDTHQVEIKKKVDSLRIINKYLETLNKKDGVSIKQIKQNIIKIDSIVDNANLTELQKLLYRSVKK